MARLPRLCIPGIPQHIIQRGVNRQVCFAAEEDFAAYAHWLRECAVKYHVAVHAWVFMTNHVHLLVTPQDKQSTSRMMQTLGRYYVRYFNRTYCRTGTLWEGRFKSSLVSAEEYLLICQRYIELNPVRAGMVSVPGEYRWSSYCSNGLGRPAKLWTPHPVYSALGNSVKERTSSYRQLFSGHLDDNLVMEIRELTNKGMALGNDKFKEEIEVLIGRRVRPLKRGPSPKI